MRQLASVVVGAKRETTRTGIGGKRYHPGEDKKTGERSQVYRIPTWEGKSAFSRRMKVA